MTTIRYRTGDRVLATDTGHGFTQLEVEDIGESEVIVVVDPRVGVRRQRCALARDAITHVLRGGTWVRL